MNWTPFSSQKIKKFKTGRHCGEPTKLDIII